MEILIAIAVGAVLLLWLMRKKPKPRGWEVVIDVPDDDGFFDDNDFLDDNDDDGAPAKWEIVNFDWGTELTRHTLRTTEASPPKVCACERNY